MAKNPITILAEGNKLLNELEQKLVGVNNNLLEISKSARSTNLKDFFDTKSPNDVNEKLKLQQTIIQQLNAEVKERDRLEKALSNQLAKNKLAESELNKELVKQRFETQQRNKEIKASAILSSKLSTEYQKLVVRMNQAGSAVQSLVAKQAQGIKLSNQEQAELKQSQLEFKKYQTAVLKADASIGRFQRNVGNYQSALGKAGMALRNFAGVFGVLSAGVIAKEVFDLIKEIDGLDKALMQVTETQQGFNQAQEFIKNLAEEAGVEINGLQKSYTKFFAAAKTTNLTLAETQDIFRQTAKAGAVLGLSTDDINGSMKALEQILSKGKVQAEEIRGQLGERLPGAFQILAKSMGLTTAQLSKQLELGNVLSEEVLPGFAKELEKTYSLQNVNRVETLTAAQNRLGNAWTGFVRSLDGSDGTITKIFTKVIDFLSDILKGLEEINTSLDDFNKNLSSDITKKQIDNYKQLGSEANAYAEINKKNSAQLIENYNKELKKQKEIIKSFDDYTSIGKFIRPAYREAKQEVDRLSSAIATQQGILKAAKIQLGEVVEEKEKDTKETKTNTDAIDKNNTARNGSLAFLKNQISTLKKERDELSLTKDEYDAFTTKINEAEAALVRLEDTLNGVENKPVNELKTTFDKPQGLNDEEFKAFLDLQERKRAEIIETAQLEKKFIERRKELELDAFNNSVELVNTLFDAKIQKYEDEINKNNDYYAALLDNENLTEEQRSALEAERDRKNLELEKKKRDEQRKAAIINKIASLATIAIQTATAASAALAPPPVGLGPVVGGALLPYIIGNGALQAAIVAAQPIPKYEQGKGEYDNYEGAAIWGEKRREVKISKDGNIEFSPNKIGNHLTHVKKDDVIHPDASKFISSLTDEQLYNDIHKYSIIASMQGQTNAINSMLIQKSIDNQTDKLIKALSNNKPKVNINQSINLGKDISFLTRLNNTL